MRRILVTGSSGFIGANLCRRLTAGGYEVFGVDRTPRASMTELSYEELILDLGSEDLRRKLPKGVDALVHLAAESSVHRCATRPQDCVINNVTASAAVSRWADLNNLETAVFASSMAVYGAVDRPVDESSILRGSSLYALSKQLGERVFMSVPRIRTAILRLFNVYGPGQDLDNRDHGMIAIYLGQALESGSITVRGSGKRTRDFVYIDDAVTAIEMALQTLPTGTYNVATGQETSVAELLYLLQLEFGRRQRTVSWCFTDETQEDIKRSVGSASKLIGLGWRPTTSLEVGLRKMIGSTNIDT